MYPVELTASTYFRRTSIYLHERFLGIIGIDMKHLLSDDETIDTIISKS